MVPVVGDDLDRGPLRSPKRMERIRLLHNPSEELGVVVVGALATYSM